MEWFLQLPLLTQIIILYLVFINIVTFFYFGIDKLKSQFDWWRVSEKTLWVLMIIGGTVGALSGMNFFKHKTKKHSFQAVTLLILLIQSAVLFLMLQ